MPLIPLSLPPGVYRNGTELQAAGRWRDSSLVRWAEGQMKPVGGWDAFSDSAIGAPVRGSIAWRGNAGDRFVVAGTFDDLTYINTDGVGVSIAPLDLTPGAASSSLNTAYGGGLYGAGSYGTTRTPSGIVTPATVWSLDTFGEWLVALSPDDGRPLLWQGDPMTPAAVIAGAPVDALALVVTSERFLFILGAGGDPRAVAWSEQADTTVWTADATNQAGDIVIQTTGALVTGLRVRGQTLLLTDIDAHTATYIGPPFVHSFEQVGTQCGVIAPDAAANVMGGAMWMGLNGFFRFDGGAVTEVPCDVSDYVFGRLNLSQRSKVASVTYATENEVWWFYPAGSEVDSYVCYNYVENHWTTGVLERTSGVDAGTFPQPIWFDATGNAYRHEIGFSYAGASLPYAVSGPVQLGNGDQIMNALELIPDENTQGDVQVTFATRFYPNSTERTYGPYTLAAPTNVRFAGRQVTLRVDGLAGRPASWRFGVPRLDVTPGGRR